ncbi:MAG TPA: hypothetical protein VIK80_04715, partial [Flavihumibacter sp.]
MRLFYHPGYELARKKGYGKYCLYIGRVRHALRLCCENSFLSCHREARSAVAISFTYLQAPLMIASLRSQLSPEAQATMNEKSSYVSLRAP